MLVMEHFLQFFKIFLLTSEYVTDIGGKLLLHMIMRHTGALHHQQEASIAQWQSTGLVNQGSRVQSSLEAVIIIFYSKLRHLKQKFGEARTQNPAISMFQVPA